MFSSITIASSTTKPTAMVSAISDRLSRLYSIRYITAKVQISATGTVTDGMMVAQTLRRNRKITITTRLIDRISVNWTSVTEARMVCVRSTIVLTLMAGGMEASNDGSFALIRSTVS